MDDLLNKLEELYISVESDNIKLLILKIIKSYIVIYYKGNIDSFISDLEVGDRYFMSPSFIKSIRNNLNDISYSDIEFQKTFNIYDGLLKETLKIYSKFDSIMIDIIFDGISIDMIKNNSYQLKVSNITYEDNIQMESAKLYLGKYPFYKKNDNDQIWWVDNGIDYKGKILFSFNTSKIYNLLEDYPNKLSHEEKQIFDSENPFWANFLNRSR